MIKIGIVGCGKWSATIINEINKNDNFKLTAMVCRKKVNIIKNKDLIIFNNIEDLVNNNLCDCIYVAADPLVNFELVNLIKGKKIPMILEKPFSNSYKDAIKMKEISFNKNIIILINLPNLYSECFLNIKKIINSKLEYLKEIKIIEGNLGPFRSNIHPIWDWSYHSISTLIHLFGEKNLSDFKIREIKKNILKKGLVTRFDLNLNSKTKIKVVNGNLFKRKIRKMKIFLQNDDIYEFDMINHVVLKNNNIIHSNTKSPLQNLFNKFYINIYKNLNTEKSKIETACITTKILENFYKY